MEPSREFARLVEIMSALRDRDAGCPWDLEQDFESIRHFTIEEAYEVADAIERKDYEDLRGELGDLLLQPVFHAQMASEQRLFDIGDVIYSITDKLIRRHPHVFGDADGADALGVKASWEDIKAEERRKRSAARGNTEPASILDDVAHNLPALSRAEKLARRAARVGFDWPDATSVLAKVDEELAETRDAMAEGSSEKLHEEIGDLLFAVANLARHAGLDPEAALRDANAKFQRRFRHVEARAREDDVALSDAGLEKLDGYWNEIRATDKSGRI